MSEKLKLGNRFIAWLDTNSIAIMTGIMTLLISLIFAYVAYSIIQFYCNDCWPVAPIEQGRGE